MKRSTNSVEVKRQNRNRVFRYVNGQEETSMPEISAALDISGPTVLTIVNELKEEGVLKEAGELKSTGGRKAKAIAAVKDIKYAVGIDLTANHISITYTDLSEKALKHVRIRKSFEYTNEYLDALAVFTRRFIEENAIPEDNMRLRVRRDHVPYDLWASEGCLETTEGNVIHYGFIENFIEEWISPLLYLVIIRHHHKSMYE